MDLKELDGCNTNDERDHWWIKTRFLYIDKAIRMFDFEKTSSLSVVEFGHGSGQNLWFLKRKSKYSSKIKSLFGIDPMLSKELSGENVDFTQTRDLDAAKDGEADFVMAMDVLEHVDDELSAINAWKKTLKSGGIMLITVPAFMSLWSYHDEFLEHKRRYRMDHLAELANRCDLEVVSMKYAFGFLFSPMFFIRKLKRNIGSTNQDLKRPFFLVNTVLYLIGKLEAKFGGNPFLGTSVVGVFRVK